MRSTAHFWQNLTNSNEFDFLFDYHPHHHSHPPHLPLHNLLAHFSFNYSDARELYLLTFLLFFLWMYLISFGYHFRQKERERYNELFGRLHTLVYLWWMRKRNKSFLSHSLKDMKKRRRGIKGFLVNNFISLKCVFFLLLYETSEHILSVCSSLSLSFWFPRSSCTSLRSWTVKYNLYKQQNITSDGEKSKRSGKRWLSPLKQHSCDSHLLHFLFSWKIFFCSFFSHHHFPLLCHLPVDFISFSFYSILPPPSRPDNMRSDGFLSNFFLAIIYFLKYSSSGRCHLSIECPLSLSLSVSLSLSFSLFVWQKLWILLYWLHHELSCVICVNNWWYGLKWRDERMGGGER